MIWIPIALISVIIGAVALWTWYRRRTAARTWREVADAHGFDFVEPGFLEDFEMSGTYGRRPVRVFTEDRGDDEHTTTYTVYETPLPDGVPSDLVVENEGAHALFPDMFGGEDLQVGDPEIDAAFLIRSDRVTAVRNFFDTSGVREAFRELADSKGSAEIHEETLRLAEAPRETNRFALESRLDTVVDFSESIETALASPSDESPADAPDAEAGGEGTANGDADDEVVVEW